MQSLLAKPSCNAKKTKKNAKAKKHLKKVLHSKDFKDAVAKAVDKALTVALATTVSAAVEKATAAACEQMLKLQRLDKIQKKADKVLNAYANTADGASEQEQDIVVKALGDLTRIKLKRQSAIQMVKGSLTI